MSRIMSAELSVGGAAFQIAEVIERTFGPEILYIQLYYQM